MAAIERPDGTTIHYEVGGDGPPLLLLAPDAVNSQVDSWERTPFDPRTAFQDAFTVIAMDQRYAGRSTGPNVPFSYEAMAGDQLAVLAAARAERALLLGWGIGTAYALRLIRDAPGRFATAVLIEPAGRDGAASRHDVYTRFQDTLRLARAEGLEAVVEAARRNPRFDDNPAAGPYGQRLHDDPLFAKDVLEKSRERYAVRVVRFRDAMFPDDAPLLCVTESQVASCAVPLLVLPGRDAAHPPAVARRLGHVGEDRAIVTALEA